MTQELFERRRANDSILHDEAARDAIIEGLLEKYHFDNKEAVILAKTGSEEERDRVALLMQDARLLTDNHMLSMHKTSKARSAAIEHTLEMEKKAALDPLTGLVQDQEVVLHWFERERSRFKREVAEDDVMAWLELDIDHFKRINELGHTQADEVLKKLAGALQGRPSDLDCRLGGDEFSKFLYKLKKKDITVIVQRLQNSIRDIKYGDKLDKHVTVSIGVLMLDKDDVDSIGISSVGSFMKQVRGKADAAAIHAKKHNPEKHGDCAYIWKGENNFELIEESNSNE
ncbi:MAG: GGDEF domain-containing protein [Patescibacteria group bacterium]|jgi:diguanylate cyclase (GGDEF)-like protein